jgi:ABC-2 type transport system ATP-binding protein
VTITGAQPGASGGEAGVGSSAAICVRGLRMAYGDRQVLHGIDLDVPRGEVFAFLGPNGAGKTTTVQILEGLRPRSGGHVTVLGVDPASATAAWRARVGVVLQSSGPERGLTVAECLAMYAGYYRNPRPVGDLLELVGLTEAAAQRASRLSGGQMRRLDVALALVGRPELVFLDEPTTGFDPAARRSAWQMISGLRRGGVTVFLTTHYLEEAEVLADRVAVIVAGRIVAEGTPAQIRGRAATSSRVSLVLPEGVVLPPGLADGAEVAEGGGVSLPTASPTRTLAELCGWAAAQGFELADLEVRRPSLEEVYLSLTGSPS